MLVVVWSTLLFCSMARGGFELWALIVGCKFRSDELPLPKKINTKYQFLSSNYTGWNVRLIAAFEQASTSTFRMYLQELYMFEERTQHFSSRLGLNRPNNDFSVIFSNWLLTNFQPREASSPMYVPASTSTTYFRCTDHKKKIIDQRS